MPDDALQMPEFKGQLGHLLAGCVLLGKFNSPLCAFVLLFNKVIVTEPDSTDLLGSLLSSVHRLRAASGALGEGYCLQFASRRDLKRMTSQSLATLGHLMHQSSGYIR